MEGSVKTFIHSLFYSAFVKYNCRHQTQFMEKKKKDLFPVLKGAHNPGIKADM